ncbi:MAG: RNA methyltransferase [Cyanobacteria bacterium J06621_15]
MLTSLQNPLIKQIRKLHSSKERHKQELFLLEGTHLLEEACTTNYPLVNVCCTAQWKADHEQLFKLAMEKCDRTLVVSEDVMKALATTVHPDGVVATAQRGYHDKHLPFEGLQIALESLQDPGNLGTIIRTAAAAGASGLWLSKNSVDLDNPKVLRASAGQWFRLPMLLSEDLQTTVMEAKQAGMQIIATLPAASLTYWQVDWQKPSLILLGNEGAGLSAELSQIADFNVKVPLQPGVESLNVAITAALILYEVQRQKICN